MIALHYLKQNKLCVHVLPNIICVKALQSSILEIHTLVSEAIIGADTVIQPGVIIEGKTTIGKNCTIGPNSHIVSSTIGR